MHQQTEKQQLLFVDDEPRITNAMKAIFRRDYEVFTASSGNEALDIMARNEVDVIVSDQRMPEMAGDELLATVSAKYPGTMRILLTGFMDRQAMVKSINDGQIYRFISKPWNNDEVRNIVADAANAAKEGVNIPEIIPEQAQNPIKPSRKRTNNKNIGRRINKGLLVVGDKANISHEFRHFCIQHKIKIYATKNNDHALAAVTSSEDVGVVVVEMGQLNKSTVAMISTLKQARPDLIAIVLAEKHDGETAVDLVNHSHVFKYLTEPWDVEELQLAIHKAFIQHHLIKHNNYAHQRFREQQSKGLIREHLQQFVIRLKRAKI